MDRKKIILEGNKDDLLLFLATMIEVGKDMEVEVTIIVDEEK
tara:strand:- start:445 stop:570 length:126 start_codon:yes stop_codon:yes gene_type:complete